MVWTDENKRSRQDVQENTGIIRLDNVVECLKETKNHVQSLWQEKETNGAPILHPQYFQQLEEKENK